MIQRIQSIFFLLAGACFGGEFGTSFATTSVAADGIFVDQAYNLQDNVMLQILAGLGLLISLAAIFMYQNRKTQIKLGYLTTVIGVVLPIVSVLIFMNQTKSMPDIEINDQLGLYLPIGMIAFSLLAVRFTRKDEKLVESMDRLR